MGTCVCQRLAVNSQTQLKQSEISQISELTTSCTMPIGQSILTDSYKLTDMIGSGTYGVVWRAVHRSSGQVRAVKILKKTTSNEVAFLKKLTHPNIIRLFEAIESADSLCIVTEYCRGASLFTVIGKPLPEPLLVLYMSQILSSVKHCHDMNIVHRDIKPENILFKSNNVLKLIDFGISTTANPPSVCKLGTSFYIAPEVLQRPSDAKCDVWSCGVILYILATGQPPFNACSNQELFIKIQYEPCTFLQKSWDSYSPLLQDLVKSMLRKDPNERISAAEALNHPWLTSRNQVEKQ